MRHQQQSVMSHVACVFYWPIISITANLLFLSAFRSVNQPFAFALIQEKEQAPLNAKEYSQILLQQ